MITESPQRLSDPAYKEIKPQGPGIQYRRENMAPVGLTASMSIDEVARDLIDSRNSSIVGEVMNLDDFLDEVSEPDPKFSPRRDHLVENVDNMNS